MIICSVLSIAKQLHINKHVDLKAVGCKRIIWFPFATICYKYKRVTCKDTHCAGNSHQETEHSLQSVNANRLSVVY